MKPTKFLNEGNQYCSTCKCNTSTTLDSTCKLCGTKKLKETNMLDMAKTAVDNKTKRSLKKADNSPFEAYGIRGLERKPWRKTFKNAKQLEAYCERWDAEVLGTRDLEAAKRGSLSPAMGINEVKSGEIANHPWVCRRAKIKGTNEVGEVIRVCREHTFSQMVPFITMVWIKLDSGETKEVRKNHVQIAKKTMGLDEDTSSSCIATAPGGKTGPSGPAGSLFGGAQKRVSEESTSSNSYCVSDKKGYVAYTGTKEGAQAYIKKNPGKGLKMKNIKKAKSVTNESWDNYYNSLDEFSQEILKFVQERFGGQAWFKGGSYAYKIDSSKPNQMMASDGSPIRVANIAQGLSDYCDSWAFDDFADCDPFYWDEFFRPVKNKIPMARDGAPMYGGEQERHELANLRGESKQSNMLKGIALAEAQLNEYKPKIIPKTLASGKLNPNHPGNAAAIANEKEAKYKRQERIRQEKAAKAAAAKTRTRKEKALSKGQKIRAKLGSDKPNTPLEKKAQEAMWQVWNAIAPDAIEAMSYGGYEDEEDLFTDPFYVAEICVDANHMQSFADLSPEEEREILDNLDRKTLARLASNFGV